MSSFIRSSGLVVAVSMLSAAPALADPFTFGTGNVTNQIAIASRPDAGGKTEREAADDFVTTAQTMITSATFTGLFVGLPGAGAPTLGEVVVEMYRVFPKDSDTVRSPNVPTRANSPSDVAFDSRDSAVAGQLSFSTAVLDTSFTASNSVLNGINPKPNQATGGEGPVTGTEVRFTVNFTTPFILPADHYFFVPQVQLTNGEFYWLSASRGPIDATGTPFAPDLQSWIRSDVLDPDWLRVGTDIVGGQTPPTYNQAFTLAGTVAAVPEPESWALMLAGLAGISGFARRARRAEKSNRVG
jgi:PEP-CTERM motif-containing protein